MRVLSRHLPFLPAFLRSVCARNAVGRDIVCRGMFALMLWLGTALHPVCGQSPPSTENSAAESLSETQVSSSSQPTVSGDTTSVDAAEAAMGAMSVGERRKEARRRAVAGFTHLRQDAFEEAHHELQAAVALWPQHFQFVAALATCEAQLGHAEKALERLRALIGRGYSVRLAGNDGLAGLRDLDGFAAALTELETLQNRTVGTEDEVFRLPQRDLIPEAVVFDEVTQSYFVSSIRQRKILRRNRHGVVSELHPNGPMWAVSGLAIDPSARLLWAGTGALPNMLNSGPEDEGMTALVAFDLDSGDEVLRFESRVPGHRLADLTVGPGGTVYVSDAGAGVWSTVADGRDGADRDTWLRRGASQGEPAETMSDSRVTTDAPAETVLENETTRQLPVGLRLISPPDHFRSPQGLAVSDDGKHLWVADYSYGLTVFDVTKGEWFYAQEPAGVALLGIDGLHFMDGALIAIQNGSRPQRILQLHPDLTKRQITRSEVLAMNLPSWSEPTLGTVVGRNFVYVANSQWDRFDAEGGLPAVEDLAEPRILRLRVTP